MKVAVIGSRSASVKDFSAYLPRDCTEIEQKNKKQR